jgi:hypothetical protein
MKPRRLSSYGDRRMARRIRDIQLEAFIRNVARGAEKSFNRQGEHPPMFVGMNAQDEKVIFPIHELPTKSAAALAMRIIAKEAKLVRCCLINEAWVLQQKYDPATDKPTIADFDRRYPDGLEHAPGRVERLIFSGEDYSGSAMGWQDIIRPAGPVSRLRPYLGKLVVERWNFAEGLYATFLPPRGTKQ